MRYLFHDFCFDATNMQLAGPQGEISLRPMTVKLLQVLLENAPQLLRHDELLDRVWGRQEVTLGVLSQSVRELRQALGDSAQESRFIETKHRLGYRFIAELQRVADQPETNESDANVATADVFLEPAAIQRNRPRSQWVALGLVLLSALIWQLWPSTDVQSSTELDRVELVHDGRPQEPQALAWYRQGLEALQRGDLAEAQERFHASLEREPGSAAAMVALGDTFSRAGALNDARRWAASAEQDAVDLPRAEQLRIAAFRARIEYRWDDARAHLQALFQLNPGDTESGFRLAEAEIIAGRLGEADATLQRLESLDTPALDAFQMALMRAQLATARGQHAARLAAAEQALDLAASERQRVDASLELAWSQLLLGQTDNARQRLDAMRSTDAGTPTTLSSVRLTMLDSTLKREAGDYPAALAGFRDAASSADTLGQDALAARADREAAFVQIQAGDAAAAVEALAEVIERLDAQGDTREAASARDVLSLAQQRVGNMDAALAASQSALDAYVTAGDRIGEASVRNQLGMLKARTGKVDEAQAQWEQAHVLFESLGDRRGAATALSNLAIVYGRAGRIDESRKANEAALVDFRELGSSAEVARLQFNMGVQDRSDGSLHAAETRFREAQEAFAKIGAVDHQRQAAASLAELLLSHAELFSAAEVLAEVADLDGAAAQPRAAVITARARLAALRGDLESADSGFREAMALRTTAGLDDWARMNALDLGELAARRGLLAESEQVVRQLRRDMLDGKDGGAALQAGILLAGTLAAQGRTEAAERLLDQLEAERKSHPDAMQTLRLDLVRAAIRQQGRTRALHTVADSARDIGFELLALRADLLAGGEVGLRARDELQRRGILIEGMPPPLPY